MSVNTYGKLYIDGVELPVSDISYSHEDDVPMTSPAIHENDDILPPPRVYEFNATTVLTSDRDWNALRALDAFIAELEKMR